MNSFRPLARNVNVYQFLAAVIITLLYLDGFSCSESNLALIKEACDNGLDFDKIAQYKEFVEIFKYLDEQQLKANKINKVCLADRQAILELDDIITKNYVCEIFKIDKIIEYHKKFFKLSLFSSTTKPVTHKFFVKYAIQVAYTCKKNLLTNLSISREELRARRKTFEQARDRVYHEEPTIKSNIKLIEEQPDLPASSNVRPHDEAELTMGEYREALVKLQRPEDILTFEPDECKSGSKRHETMVQHDKVELFFKPALMCHQLHRYYAGSILSLARLANHGYMALDEELDAQIQSDPVVRDWVIAVQVCEPMLFMTTKTFRGDMAIIDTCSSKVNAIEALVFDDHIGELESDLLDRLVPKSQATRGQAQKLMKSAYKRMAKIDLMKQLKSGAKRKSIFSKSLSILTNQNAAAELSNSSSRSRADSFSKHFTIQLSGDMAVTSGMEDRTTKDFVRHDLTDEESFELLQNFVDTKHSTGSTGSKNDIDKPVAFADPLSSLASSLAIFAIMLSFEWLFFIVMTLAARICNQLHFDFGSVLTFPPKFLSWSDADFASYNEQMEKMDEDDFFDYDELTPDEKKQRDLLNKLFGKPPPMVFRE